ncbi:MAG TPA: hypothetical protein VMR45_05265 [Patescibacteria group bacterium]|nr:hypothetical protein [Patescibacteria group bacterium]
MAGIEDVGGSIEEAFGPRADALRGVIEEAARRTREIEAQFEGAVSGSENPLARTLREQLSRVIMGLGSAAAALQETQPTSQGLLAAWGVGSSATGGSSSETANPTQGSGREAPPARDLRTWLNPNSQSLLNATLDRIITPAAHKQTQRAVFAARRGGVETVRDAIVIGAENLEKMRGIRTDTVGVLRDSLSRKFPDVMLPARSDPAIAARICPSLSDVPFQALEGYDRMTTRGARRVTIQDVLDKPAAELFIRKDGISDSDKITEWDVGQFNQLRQKAQEYAANFAQARQALGLD